MVSASFITITGSMVRTCVFGCDREAEAKEKRLAMYNQDGSNHNYN